MTAKTRLLQELQGDMTQTDFANLLEISQPYLSMIYAEQREPGLTVAKSLLRVFPDQRDEIARVFFAEDITDVIGVLPKETPTNA